MPMARRFEGCHPSRTPEPIQQIGHGESARMLGIVRTPRRPHLACNSQAEGTRVELATGFPAPHFQCLKGIKTPSKHRRKHGRARPSTRWLSPLFFQGQTCVGYRFRYHGLIQGWSMANRRPLTRARYHSRYRFVFEQKGDGGPSDDPRIRTRPPGVQRAEVPVISL